MSDPTPTPSAPAAPAPAADPQLLTPPAPATPAAGNTPQNGNPNAQPKGDQPPADGRTPEPSAKPPAAPDAKPVVDAPIEYKLTVPPEIPIDEAGMKEFTALAQKGKISPEVAQELVNFQVRQIQQADAAYKALTKSWVDESKKMLGQDFDKELGYAAKFRDKFADKALLDLLKETGLTNHPAIVKLFVSAGKAIAEDRFADGKSANAGDGQTARLNRLFPTSAPKK